MNKCVIGLVGLAFTATASVGNAEEFRLQGEYWGNTSAPNGWVDSQGLFGRLPTANDDAKATALCESVGGSPCFNVFLQDANTKGPVTTTVKSFDGSGRRLYIGSGGELWATGASQVAGLTFDGGQLTTSSTFTIGKMTVNDAGSTVRSVMTAPNSGVYILSQSADVQGTLDFRGTSGEVRNDGTLTQTGVGNMSLWFGMDFRNRNGGVVDFQNDNGIGLQSPDFGQGPTPIQFRNEAGATVKKSGGSGTSSIDAPIVNAGTVTASSGSLSLAGGGTHSAGAVLEGTGSGGVALLGSHTVTGAVTTTGDGGVYVGDFGKAGSLTIANGGTLSNAGRLYQSASGTLTLESGGKLDNTQNGQIYFEASSNSTVASGGRFDNSGFVRLDGSLVNSGDVTVKSGGLFSDGSGSYTQQAGSTKLESGGFFGLNGNYLQNGGVTTIAAGANMSLGVYDNANDVWIGGSYTQTAGTTTINGFLDSDSVLFEGGTLSGAGTIKGDVVIDPSVNNSGTVHIVPGNSPGILTIDGNFMASSAIFDFEIGGYGAGQFDQLNVTGDATITGGQINFLFINGFVPKVGDMFTWLLASSISLDGLAFSSNLGGVEGELDELGRFLVTNAPGGGGSGNPVPEPGTLVLFGLGLAAMQLGRRHVTV